MRAGSGKKKKTARKTHTPQSKWKTFLHYLAVVAVAAVLSIYLFENRQQIGKAVGQKVEAAKSVVEQKKPAPKTDGVGYTKEAREHLEMLIHEEAKND